jgi:hypothetical protein
MPKPIAVAVALLALAASGPSQDDPINLTMVSKTPSFKVRRPRLVLNGTAALSDGVILKLQLTRMMETAVGPVLQPGPSGKSGGGNTGIESRKFVYNASIDGPGSYVVDVLLVDELQDRDLAAEVKKKAGARRQWRFEFPIWGDELIPAASSLLPELMPFVQDARELLRKFDQASATKEKWLAEMKPLVAEGRKYLAKLESSELNAYFPAAMNNLRYSVGNFVGGAAYYTYGEDGKFTGAKDYHKEDNKAQTFTGEAFSWANYRKYIENTPTLAGREFCLWIVKDLRRTAGQMSPEIQKAITTHKAAPGVDFFQERLLKATILDLDSLEAQIRGVKPPTPPPSDKQ